MTMSPASAPFGATDVIAVVLLTLAFVFWMQERRDHEPGMGWCSLAMGMLGVWIGADPLHAPTDPLYMRQSWWFIPLCISLIALCIGITKYLHTQPQQHMRALVLLITPTIISAILCTYVTLTGAHIMRAWLAVLTSLPFVGLSAMSLGASKREPQAGHRVLAIAFAAIPIQAVVLALTRPGLVAVRYWGALVLTIVGMTLLTVVLMRRRQRMMLEIERRAKAEEQLMELNNSLEATVERRTRELRELVGGLESFNRSVSHDLRGPLGGISGLASLAQIALAKGDVAKAQQLLAPIIEQSESSTRMVNALLALAHTSNAPVSHQTVDLHALAHTIAAVHANAQDAAGPIIDIGHLPQVESDPDLLRIVLTNLINNAIKFTRGKPGGRVSVRSQSVEGRIEISVHDNGVGFDNAKAASLFEPFQRMHGKEYEGHGIGLSIVQRAVERLGGTVQAVGQLGVGATFIVSLPHTETMGETDANLVSPLAHRPTSNTLH